MEEDLNGRGSKEARRSAKLEEKKKKFLVNGGIKMNELVSIIVPAYNTGKYIGRMIRSVQAQTYSNWELVIVDDCSTDDTRAVVESFDDERIRYFRNERNKGAALSRNYALREARGRWIAFLDSDDIWMPEKLERQIGYMKENGYAFTYTDYRVVSPEGKLLPYVFVAPDHVTRKLLYRYCYFATITVIYDREVIGLIQIEDLKKRNDYAMWYQAIEKTDCHRLPEVLSCYIRREGSISNVSLWKLIGHQYLLYRKGLKKNRVVSLYMLLRNMFFGFFKKLLNKRRITDDVDSERILEMMKIEEKMCV